MVFHPRKRLGFGWTNGEGNERIWALSADTISNERIMGVSTDSDQPHRPVANTQQPNRRLLLLDRKYSWIAEFKFGRLASLMKRKLKDLSKAEEDARRVLSDLQKGDTRWTPQALKDQWASQKEQQLSVRACTCSPYSIFSHMVLTYSS